MVSPCSDRISRVPPYSRTISASTRTGLSPTPAEFPNSFRFVFQCHWPGPRSLATTCGVSVDVLSCRYLDVSVPCVRFLHPMYSGADTLLTILGNLFPSNRPTRTDRVSFVLTLSHPSDAALRTARPNMADGPWPCEASLRSVPKAKFKQNRFPKYLKVGCPIRRSMDQSLFAAPHGFSQRITSFFACACQGIHQMPLSHFFVLIANAHPCLIWQTQPLTSVSGVPNLAIRARSPLRVPLLLPKTRSLLTIKQETNDTVTFYNHV